MLLPAASSNTLSKPLLGEKVALVAIRVILQESRAPWTDA
jgi:hypothetical protein